MPIEFKDLLSGAGNAGGRVITQFEPTLTIPATTPAGTLVTITPPPGKRVILTGLSGATNEPNITVTGSLLGTRINNLELGNGAVTTTTSRRFMIGVVSSTVNAVTPSGLIPELPFEIDEVVTISKSSATTINIIYYSYAYGS